MLKYTPLTKRTGKSDDETGSKTVECAFADGDVCRSVHKNCRECAVFDSILKMLNTFEEIYFEEADDDTIRNASANNGQDDEAV